MIRGLYSSTIPLSLSAANPLSDTLLQTHWLSATTPPTLCNKPISFPIQTHSLTAANSLSAFQREHILVREHIIVSEHVLAHTPPFKENTF